MSDDLTLAVEAAHGAGELLLSYWSRREQLVVSAKRSGDFVTEADVNAEALLHEMLLAANPGDGWLGEEKGASTPASRRWVIDPLDGTTNFLRGIPHWAVSVALEVEGELTMGVVYDPVKQETFAAERGHGVTVNGHTLTGSSITQMHSALFGTGIPFADMAHIDDHAADIARLMPHCAGVRRMGCASLDLAYVAAGRLDGFWERKLQPWDIAAGLVLMREAGVVVQGWSAHERPEDTGTVIAAPPGLFTAFAQLLRQA